MTLFNDPEHWARSAAGSNWRVVLMIALHALLCVVVLFTVRSWQQMAPSVLFVGLAYPAMYVYAMFRLIKRIDELERLVAEKKLSERSS